MKNVAVVYPVVAALDEIVFALSSRPKDTSEDMVLLATVIATEGPLTVLQMAKRTHLGIKRTRAALDGLVKKRGVVIGPGGTYTLDVTSRGAAIIHMLRCSARTVPRSLVDEIADMARVEHGSFVESMWLALAVDIPAARARVAASVAAQWASWA